MTLRVAQLIILNYGDRTRNVQLYNAEINRENEGKKANETNILKSRPTGGEGKTMRKVRKKKRNRRERDSTEGTVDDSERKKRNEKGEREGETGEKKRNNLVAVKKKPMASASGVVCGVGARPLSSPVG